MKTGHTIGKLKTSPTDLRPTTHALGYFGDWGVSIIGTKKNGPAGISGRAKAAVEDTAG